MTPAGEVEMSQRDLDALAWKFLSSEFTGPICADWPIDRRVEAYLLHYAMMEIINDRAAYTALLDRIMANIGAALRRGILAPPNR